LLEWGPHLPACVLRLLCAEISVQQTADILQILNYLCSHIIKHEYCCLAVIFLMSRQAVYYTSGQWHVLWTLIFFKTLNSCVNVLMLVYGT
jgi:hypothetical protein